MAEDDKHNKIREAIIDICKSRDDDDFPAINIEAIADKAGVDTRTVRYHLDVIRHYGLGNFGDRKKRTFMPDETKICAVGGLK